MYDPIDTSAQETQTAHDIKDKSAQTVPYRDEAESIRHAQEQEEIKKQLAEAQQQIQAREQHLEKIEKEQQLKLSMTATQGHATRALKNIFEVTKNVGRDYGGLMGISKTGASSSGAAQPAQTQHYQLSPGVPAGRRTSRVKSEASSLGAKSEVKYEKKRGKNRS